DIATGPVVRVNYRLRAHGLRGDARRGSILAAPFADASFDCVVAIGCFHHTGNIQRALDESYRVLRQGGLLIGMVYNAYSYRRWVTAPRPTLKYLSSEIVGWGHLHQSGTGERTAYDNDLKGCAAPHTDFI